MNLTTLINWKDIERTALEYEESMSEPQRLRDMKKRRERLGPIMDGYINILMQLPHPPEVRKLLGAAVCSIIIQIDRAIEIHFKQEEDNTPTIVQ